MEDLKEIIGAVKENVDFMERLEFKLTPSLTCENYDLIYPWTNEDINGSLKAANVKPNSGLTVLSSGDHPFNLVTIGATNIDTFDSNSLTEFYALGFKRAMILKYNYSQFKRNMANILAGRISFDDVNELIKGLFPYMEERHRLFFQELIDYTYKKKLPVKNIIDFLVRDEHDIWKFQLNGNNFLLNEKNYDILRANLARANITFKKLDALNLQSEFKNNKYDIIMLSNIFDYFFRFSRFSWTYEVILSYERELEALLGKDGVLFLYYVFKTPAPDGQIYPFNKCNIIPEHLKEEELVRFHNCYGSDSLVVLKREGSKERTLKI